MISAGGAAADVETGAGRRAVSGRILNIRRNLSAAR